MRSNTTHHKPSAQSFSAPEIPPIDIGSKWHRADRSSSAGRSSTSSSSTGSSSLTVIDIWVGENGTTQVQARTRNGQILTLTSGDFRNQIKSGTLQRIGYASGMSSSRETISRDEASRDEATNRAWIQVSAVPLRYEYGYAHPGNTRPTGVLAYVEREPADYFSWGVYRGHHAPQAAASLGEAKTRALATLRERGTLERSS